MRANEYIYEMLRTHILNQEFSHKDNCLMGHTLMYKGKLIQLYLFTTEDMPKNNGVPPIMGNVLNYCTRNNIKLKLQYNEHVRYGTLNECVRDIVQIVDPKHLTLCLSDTKNKFKKY